jgi:arginine decarboxylase
MKKKYIDLIEQTFEYPQAEFKTDEGGHLVYHDIPLMDLIQQYGSPVKFTYLPKISESIQNARTWFNVAIAKADYKGKYHYCYCTKSSHFSHILEEVLKNDCHIETSSAFDINIVQDLSNADKLDKDTYVICNGFKKQNYINNIANLINDQWNNVIPIIDNQRELELLDESIHSEYNCGIRIASEEDPKFEFYTSRLGIGYQSILPFYLNKIKHSKKAKLKMLHFFINTGIYDNAYYWNELRKCVKVYCQLKKECPSLTTLNIGGGFPIKNSLRFTYDYEYMATEIISQIKIMCNENDVDEPDIFTEFGSYTVGESGGAIFSVLDQKPQNDREKWNMIDSSFMTTLPDAWAINKRFVMLPVNRWNEDYERVLLGGITCDSDDYYNSEQHVNAIYLPKYDPENPLYIGFFNTGAYQESIGGFGGIQHCLTPAPKHVIIDKDDKGNYSFKLFSKEQSYKSMLKTLGY